MVLFSPSEGSLGWRFNTELLFPFLGGTGPVRCPGVSARGDATHREHMSDKKLSARHRLRAFAIAGGHGQGCGAVTAAGSTGAAHARAVKAECPAWGLAAVLVLAEAAGRVVGQLAKEQRLLDKHSASRPRAATPTQVMHRNASGVSFSLCCSSGKLPLTPNVPMDSFVLLIPKTGFKENPGFPIGIKTLGLL